MIPGTILVSELIRGTVDGAPLTDEQLVAYCELLVEAGNETTRNAISGGLLAFCEHPDEWDEAARSIRSCCPTPWRRSCAGSARSATSRVSRPRTARSRGVTIRAGDQLALFFASANRDEEVFEEPFSFRIDRNPNPHLAFGFGEHFCMGAHLARVEVETSSVTCSDASTWFELAGPVMRLESAVNGSIKHLPLRYRSV